ncbi:LytR C-terminal domain-containing protein [Actinoalloteichus spitiensis]|uniref:LytR C-terminal domain-containing protein n=1 Tax=Actinoalloteichus spitiensis TaxID=252394 RepID=UPI000474A3CD|nr:LytR C-terminal domain-containing protein [Actinoalloteichus spitiensis]
MSNVDPAGSARPLRIAAIGMFAVAILALVVGVVSLTQDDGEPTAAESTLTSGAGTSSGSPSPTGPPPESASSSPGSPEDDDDAEDAEDARENGEDGTPEDGAGTPEGTEGSAGGSGSDSEGTGSSSTGSGDDGGELPELRVYNNSTVRGLASRAAGDFRDSGWDVSEVGNYSAGVIPSTTIYYRPGTPEEQLAGEIGAAFGIPVEPRFDGIRDAAPGVIVIVTNNYGQTSTDPK